MNNIVVPTVSIVRQPEPATDAIPDTSQRPAAPSEFLQGAHVLSDDDLQPVDALQLDRTLMSSEDDLGLTL